MTDRLRRIRAESVSGIEDVESAIGFDERPCPGSAASARRRLQAEAREEAPPTSEDRRIERDARSCGRDEDIRPCRAERKGGRGGKRRRM